MAKSVAKVPYENNPFYITLNGIQLLIKNAQSVAVYAAILAGISLIVSIVISFVDLVISLGENSSPNTTPDLLFLNDVSLPVLLGALGFVVLVSFIAMLIGLFLYGILEYTAAHLAKNEKVTLKQAIAGVWQGYLGYIWVYLIALVKIFLWTLLFIVPGIIMSVRYTLAGTVYFAENKRGNAAIKRSSELTKGAWFTTFASFGLWNFITFNALTPLVNPSAATILYRQLKDVTDEGTNKPPTHWLSWLTFFGPVVLFFMLIWLVAMIGLLLWTSL